MDYVISHEESTSGGAFLIEEGGKRLGEMSYRRLDDKRVVIDHTHVDPRLRGGGVARQLLDAAVAWARKTGTSLSATCSYVVVQFARDKSLADVQS